MLPNSCGQSLPSKCHLQFWEGERLGISGSWVHWVWSSLDRPKLVNRNVKFVPHRVSFSFERVHSSILQSLEQKFLQFYLNSHIDVVEHLFLPTSLDLYLYCELLVSDRSVVVIVLQPFQVFFRELTTCGKNIHSFIHSFPWAIWHLMELYLIGS